MRRNTWIATTAGVVVLAVAAVVVGVSVGSPEPEPESTRAARATTTPTPSATRTPTLAAVPAAPSDATLAALPLAFHDAVVPQLLDGSDVEPEDTWQIATPRTPLVALYASPSSRARPVATLSHLVSTINRPAATAVWGRSPGKDGGMLLVSTPSRNRTPGDGGDPDAPSATFAWARAADFTVVRTDRMITVDVAASTVSVVTRSGKVTATEAARLGTPEDPTPADTATYVEAAYVDTRVAYTQGNPIILTGAHSSRIPSYGGNAALTALHYYPDPTGSSHGCVRISAEMTRTLAALPVGTPIRFS
ncbi:L,D-transpeptidase [Curtobacterium sp. VKM Ac-2889]|uniref:L,D-transpeptidase n=1 Tax=Curtobacterium poinsettiae TaxID=159612 RepID=A0ABT3RY82_9MICO|nr:MULTISPECIES: L,D-transpeptidase [Curtobacterium]MBF4598523.1 L,D-transpeptidase [Curtobacterium sp. VKM Ac-1796]MBF4611740.1 L,D-transpeptidase [Curtobacterium sp. VKM Ac-2889]MBT1611185.1 L,D-transpeptidase [Curtobacterium flaccumfaciens pv. poinsettiae]MCU0114150.1 L,D-transpeptidase [Curtobacterium flaccumfaciens]MCX2847188.1 L,D-transpeptidase [Curtobacterium flaccumfaciens pv. poinsettiae]